MQCWKRESNLAKKEIDFFMVLKKEFLRLTKAVSSMILDTFSRLSKPFLTKSLIVILSSLSVLVCLIKRPKNWGPTRCPSWIPTLQIQFWNLVYILKQRISFRNHWMVSWCRWIAQSYKFGSSRESPIWGLRIVMAYHSGSK